MPLTVLSDFEVNKLLHSYNKEDIEALQETLADALHWYSTSNDANDCCSDYQPQRTHLKRKDGSTTLFMPASGLTGQGVKVVNIVPPDASGLPAFAETASVGSGNSRSSISGQSRTDSISTLSSMASSTTNVSSKTKGSDTVDKMEELTMNPATGGGSRSTIRGSLTLLDNLGNTTGLINAEEVTAFRTALAATMLLKKRHSVHTVTIFGAGKQAYWHARLALLLRGPEIHHLNLITRNFETARRCIQRLYDPQPSDPTYINPIGPSHNSRTQKEILTPSHTEYHRLLKEFVRSSEVIFCTTPSTTPLFPATYLTNPNGRKKGRYISLIGSYTPHMVELHPDILKDAVAPHHAHKHIHQQRQTAGGAIIVDTVSGCLKEAGEVIQAGLTPDQVVELGELFMLKREAEEKLREMGEEKVEAGCSFREQEGLGEWLTRGNVIYKSVGLGLMDVTVGNALVETARERGVGITIERF